MQRLLPSALGVALALPLLVYGATGSFARYTADDYCWAGVLRTEGFFKAQVLWYTGYSPRYAFTFLVNLVELAGPAIVPVLPAIAILAYVATLTWTVGRLGIRLVGCSTRLAPFVVAELVALATLQTAPDLPQSLYWQTGMLTYLLPLVLATLLIGWIARGLDRWWAVVLSSVLTFVAGGLSETYLIPQNVALTLALGCCLIFAAPSPRRRTTALHLASALVGGVLALAVIVASPSTASRVGGAPADLWLASSAAIATAAVQVQRLGRYFPLTILLCLGLPALLGDGTGRINRTWFVMVSGVVVVTLPFCYFPSFYAQNGNPPARSLIVPGAILIGYLVCTGFALQSVLARLPEPRRLAVALVLALVPLGIAVISLPEPALAAQQAALWDAQDQQIRASRDAGQLDITVPPRPRYLGEEFVSSDRTNWFNVCVARYYGVRSIATTP